MTVERQEPYDGRPSRTVLWEPGGHGPRATRLRPEGPGNHPVRAASTAVDRKLPDHHRCAAACVQVRVLRLDGETAIGTRTTQKGAQRLDRVGPQQLPRHPCGYRRVHAALARRGVETSPDTVRSIMREQGLEAAQPRRKARRHRPGRRARGARPDLVRRNFTASQPGMKRVGDIHLHHHLGGTRLDLPGDRPRVLRPGRSWAVP